MKIHSKKNAFYEVRSTKDQYGLYVYATEQTFDACVEAIKRAEEKAAEGGYPPTEWLIVSVEYETTWQDGMFYEEKRTRRAVAHYYDGIVEDL